MRIIETVQDAPIRLLPYEPIEIGDIVEFYQSKCVISSGIKPFGIVSETGGPYGLVSIWYDTMVFRTNKFEVSKYKSGDPIYCSINGKITNIPPFTDAYMLGHVITFNEKEIEVNWI